MTVNLEKPDKGLLVYDMPTRLGSRLRARLCGKLLSVNNSVKVGRWDDRDLIEGIVSEVVAEATPEERARVDWHFLGQHDVSDKDLTGMAEKAAIRQLQDLHKCLRDRIAKVPEMVSQALEARKIDVNDVSKRKAQKIRTVIRDVQKRSEGIGRIAVFLAIEDSLKGWAGMVTDLLVAEQKALEDLKAQIKAAAPVVKGKKQSVA